MHLLCNWEFLAHGYTRLIICTRFSDSGKGVFSAIFRFFSAKNHLGGGKGQGRQLSAVSKFHLSARIFFIDSRRPRPNQCWKMMADASDMSDGILSMFRKNEKNSPFSWRGWHRTVEFFSGPDDKAPWWKWKKKRSEQPAVQQAKSTWKLVNTP